jgi:hypothetical protein|tara:strand:+ start:564 stop:719 length:156 start_codon:yes stop_codon:yes gene_type:complete
MDINERIRDIVDNLEEAISYEDFTLVAEARKELLFILDEMENQFPPTDNEY